MKCVILLYCLCCPSLQMLKGFMIWSLIVKGLTLRTFPLLILVITVNYTIDIFCHYKNTNTLLTIACISCENQGLIILTFKLRRAWYIASAHGEQGICQPIVQGCSFFL